MKITINHAGLFRDKFAACERKDQFSYEAFGLIFDYLEECDPDYELDVIAICCDYAESTPEEIIESYGIEYDGEKPKAMEAAIAYLEENTSIVGTTSSGSIVYFSNF